MRNSSIAYTVLCAMLLTADFGIAQNDVADAQAPSWIVLMLAVEGDEYSNSVVSFRRGSTNGNLAKLENLISRLPESGADSLVRYLRANERALARQTSSRWISRAGDRLDVYVLHSTNASAKIQVTETARTSRIESDVVTLFALATKINAMGIQSTGFTYSKKSYALTKRRATVKIAASLMPVKAEMSAADARDSGTSKAPSKEEAAAGISAALITGPAELLFLSANIGRTDAEQATFDQSTQSLTPPKKPKEVYVGANVSFGDLYGDSADGWRRFFGSLYVGAHVEASTKPLSQVGLVLGTRHLPFIDEWISLGAVSPYVGMHWVRNDSLQTSSPPGTIQRIVSKYGRREAILGLSFNLTKALGWIGADEEKQEKK